MPTGDWTRDALRDEYGRIIGRRAAASEAPPEAVLSAFVEEAALLEPSAPARAGIERELVVVAQCANPKLIRCAYMELASRRTCVVDVGRNAKWLKGMRFKMIEPADEEAYVRPWKYAGRGPRLRGRW